MDLEVKIQYVKNEWVSRGKNTISKLRLMYLDVKKTIKLVLRYLNVIKQ